MQLREYQLTAIENVSKQFAAGNRRVILQSATGSGKTVIFCEMARRTVAKGGRVLIFTDRKELLSQSHNSLEQFGIVPKILNAETKTLPTNYTVVVAMAQTFKRRVNQAYTDFIQSFGLIIIDEAHENIFNDLFLHLHPMQYVVGPTATPIRRNPMPELAETYNAIVETISINELIQKEYLSEPHYFGIKVNLENVHLKGGEYDETELTEMYSKNKIFVGVVTQYKKHTNGQKAIVFSASVQSSKELQSEFIANGYDCDHVDSYMDKSERDAILEKFAASKNSVLCNVGILTKGYDCPDIEVVILYRATTSLALYLQMCGRGSRVTNDKKSFTILDFGNNVKRLGFWHEDRIWSLNNPPKKKKGEEVPAVKECPQCDRLVPVAVSICPFCGFVFPVQKKKKTKEEVELVKLEYKEKKLQTIQDRYNEFLVNGGSLREFLQTIKHDRPALFAFAKMKNYKAGWVHHQFKPTVTH